MTEQHPITPPPELVKQWLAEFYGPESMPGMAPGEMVLHVAAVAARWGADQELEACCEWLTTKAMTKPWETVPRPVLVTALVLELRAARRPKPPSLKEQVLKSLEGLVLPDDAFTTISRALKRLQELEGQGDGFGTRANGGPVPDGIPYLVGERNPEALDD